VGITVCQIKHHWDPEKKSSTIEEVVPIAGDLEKHGGGAFKWEATRLKTEGEDKGEDKGEGIRLTLKGGVYEQREQRALVSLRCNQTVSGLDGEWDSEDEYVHDKREEKEGDKNGDDEVGFPEKQLKKDNAALIWDGYKRDGDVDTLFLTWYTQHVCEKSNSEQPPADESHHWGFFTWVIIL